MAQQLTRTVGVISLSRFLQDSLLLAIIIINTLTINRLRLYFVPGLQKHVPYPPCTVIGFWLKYRDPARMLRRVTLTTSTAGPLAARQICTEPSLHRDIRRTSKSFAAHPCNRPVAAKHMLFNNPRLLFYIDFITLRQSPLTIPEKKQQ